MLCEKWTGGEGTGVNMTSPVQKMVECNGQEILVT